MSPQQDASRGALLSHHRKDETFAVSCTIPRREEAEQIQRQMKKVCVCVRACGVVVKISTSNLMVGGSIPPGGGEKLRK